MNMDSTLPAPSSGSESTQKRAPVVVAVFGKTGTGKTSFIKSVTGLDLKIGHGLASCTQDVEPFPFKIGEQEMFLVDTPGFDDSNLTDTDILIRIADWMSETYSKGTQLSGIIYLHRISDDRMDGASVKNLLMFGELCGENNLHNVVLATTMWEETNEEIGAKREAELIHDYWKPMIEERSQVARLSTNPDDARRLVKVFLNNTTFVPQLQQELSSGKHLTETKAGKAISDEIERISKQYAKDLESAKEAMNKAHKSENKKLEKKLKAEIEEVNKKMADLQKEKERLENMPKGRLPKQTRSFMTSRWECLGKCGSSTSSSGVWHCERCNLTQKNSR